MSNLTLDVGLAAKLKVAFARNGWTEQQIDKACKGDVLGKFLQVLLGHASITVMEHVIDCDTNPFLPQGWKVEENKKGGMFKWDISKQADALYLSATQKKGRIEGNKLREELEGKAVLNANVLDYLLAHPHLIPEEWKGKYVFFWGTIYRGSGGGMFVRFLRWRGDKWHWGYGWLDDDWGAFSPAALRAS